MASGNVNHPMPEFDDLTVADQLAVVESLLDRLESRPGDELDPALIALVRARYEAWQEHPEDTEPADAVFERLLARYA